MFFFFFSPIQSLCDTQLCSKMMEKEQNLYNNNNKTKKKQKKIYKMDI